MSVADKGGRMLQAMQDRHALLGMSLHESLLNLQRLMDSLLPEDDR